jgi:hypothetical protein
MEINKDFKNSIFNSLSLKESIAEIAEAFLDSNTRNEFLKDLPIIGWASRAITAADIIRTNFLINKILKFLEGISGLTQEEINKFEQKHLLKSKNISNFYNALLISIDCINHIDKAKIISSLFRSLIHNKINESFFLRSVNIIENIYFEDLKEYLTGTLIFTSSELYEKANVTQIYLSFGLLNSHIVQQENATQRVHQEAELRFHFTYSSFGQKFIKACNFEL